MPGAKDALGVPIVFEIVMLAVGAILPLVTARMPVVARRTRQPAGRVGESMRLCECAVFENLVTVRS